MDESAISVGEKVANSQKWKMVDLLLTPFLLVIQRSKWVFNKEINRNPRAIRDFLVIHRKSLWLLRLSISIYWLKVENSMKDFKSWLPRLEAGLLLRVTRGAA